MKPRRTRKRNQLGWIGKRSGWWTLRYYADAIENGELKRKHLSRRLCRVEKGARNNPPSNVQEMAKELLAPLNKGQYVIKSVMPFKQYVAEIYEPWIQDIKKPSTVKGYHFNLHKYILPLVGDIPLADFTSDDGQALLHNLHKNFPKMNRTSLSNARIVASAVFSHAIGVSKVLKGAVNPMRDVDIPMAAQPNETYAYSLEEFQTMLSVLSGMEKAIIGTMGYSGITKGELVCLRWENYDGEFIHVRQSKWQKHITAPKTLRRIRFVDVCPELAAILNQWKAECGNPSEGFMFPNEKQQPVNLDNLILRSIRPKLVGVVEWHGTHAFRRGVGTNLKELNIPDRDIQEVLGHASVLTTMRSYQKVRKPQLKKAMDKLGAANSEAAALLFPKSPPVA